MSAKSCIIMDMDKRKELILNTIIKEHFKIGAPVGSGILVDKYNLDISPATVRNEMSALEEEGFIIQPHTSAGRIPTEKAYNFFVGKLTEKKLLKKDEDLLKKMLANKDEFGFKQAAKALAQISQSAIFWAFHKNNLYYTGISNLFQQPEFSQGELVRDISYTIDRMDEVISSIFDDIDEGERIMIGSENPFSGVCSVVLAKYKNKNFTGLFGILGPMRMDYEKNLALVKFVKEQIK